jgi:hypothetical protein
MYSGESSLSVEGPGATSRASPVWAAGIALVAPVATGETNLQLTQPLLWAMIAISTAGAIVTFSFLVYALWRFRDPSVRRRRFG